MDSSTRLTLSGLLFFAASPAGLMLSMAGLGHGESFSVGRWIFLIGFQLVAAALCWAAAGFVCLLFDCAEAEPPSQRDIEWGNIQSGYRIQAARGLAQLPWGYRKMEEHYRAKYGTTERTG